MLILVSARKIGDGRNILFDARLTTAEQAIKCYVACDEIGKSLGASNYCRT